MTEHEADNRPDPEPETAYTTGQPPGPAAGAGRSLPAAARRALAEAEARRAAGRMPAWHPADRRPEVAGRDGPDPVRYGDWEVKGIASDF